MLLLKYPQPAAPNGPQTFVDDAIYLRDNFNITGGSAIITKYTGRSPPQTSDDSRPSTPQDPSPGTRQKLLRTRSPLISPARFLQQQRGVEAILQGTARGLFDRGERLGINQAVRDAVGEVKKNMQGIQTSRPNLASRRTSDVMRWSLDEGRSIPSSAKTITAMHKRNLQLASMLGQAMADLRAVSISDDSDKGAYVKAMDIAVAKVEFVKVYLMDSTMPLPSEISPPVSPSPRPASPSKTASPRLQAHSPLQAVTGATSVPSVLDDHIEVKTEAPSPSSQPVPSMPMVMSSASPDPLNPPKDTPEPSPATTLRPTAPVPTRSSIANSSFSWMLEPDVALPSSSKSSPPKSASPFLKTGKRPASGAKSAFLFGDEGGDTDILGTRAPLLAETEGFKLGTYRGKKDKQEEETKE
jgi:TBC1 domain family protein 5